MAGQAHLVSPCTACKLAAQLSRACAVHQATALVNAEAGAAALLDRCVVQLRVVSFPPDVSRRHYVAVLLPLAVPTTVVAVFLNWFCLKFFKHA